MPNRSLGPIHALLVITTACGQPASDDSMAAFFEPRGTDASIELQWTINESPPDAAACAAAGIAAVEITVYAEADVDYEQGEVLASVPCAPGRYASDQLLARGRYRFTADAVDADGQILGGHQPEDAVEVAPGAHVVLETAEFTTITTLVVTLAWDTDPSAALTTAGACDEASVASYGFTLRDSAGATIDAFADLPCESVLFFEDIPAGTYTLEIEGKDASGAARWTATCSDLTVADGAYVELPCAIADGSA